MGTLTTPSDSPQLLLPNYDDPETLHTIIGVTFYMSVSKEDNDPVSMMERDATKIKVLLLHMFN